MSESPPSTHKIDIPSPRDRPLRVSVVAGPDRGRAVALGPFPLRVGKSPECELQLSDPTVSGLHVSLLLVEGRVTVRDLGSRNGTFYASARVETAEVGPGARLRVGQTDLHIEPTESFAPLPASARTHIGRLHGRSDPMRRLFTLIERAAATETTVLIEGETGTGKELVAAALHELSPRRPGPFVVCDLAALAGNLAESDLFGHVRGAFTGADRERPGAFEQAHGGTLFLDEVGELPADLQPRLLRALQERQVRRVGGNEYRKVDVRVIAATNRDLVEEVRAGRFRADLYYRLSTVVAQVPPLRDRREDIAYLAESFLAEAAGPTAAPLDRELCESLAGYDWPGNVRELRNVLERAVALGGASGPSAALLGLGGPSRGALPVDAAIPFHEAKGRLVDAWERDYLAALLAASQNSVSEAARRSGLNRAHLYRLIKKHGLE